jgi:hypothetical protein
MVGDISEKFLWCRDVQHSWDHYNAKISRNKISRRSEVHQILICTRCGTFKTRFLTSQGDLLRTSYKHADGYLRKSQGRMTPADRAMIRKINLKRFGAEEE